MTAEEIYPLIEEDDQTPSLDLHAYDSDTPPQPRNESPREAPPERADGPSRESEPEDAPQPASSEAGAPPPLTPDEQETLRIQWQQRLAGAAQQAQQAGKLGGALGRLIEHLLQPQLPWRQLLAHFLTGLARDDFSYRRPSRREGDFILPSLHSQQTDLVIGLDTSGSIKPEEMREFAAEVNALKAQVRARVTLLACDASLAPEAPWIFAPWEDFQCPATLRGVGGPSFRPVFDWVADQGLRPDLLLYFTDADGEFPAREPAFPVLWLVKGKRPVPWGRRVQLN
jgi:predicted metal-dependent peptidase